MHPHTPLVRLNPPQVCRSAVQWCHNSQHILGFHMSERSINPAHVDPVEPIKPGEPWTAWDATPWKKAVKAGAPSPVWQVMLWCDDHFREFYLSSDPGGVDGFGIQDYDDVNTHLDLYLLGVNRAVELQMSLAAAPAGGPTPSAASAAAASGAGNLPFNVIILYLGAPVPWRDVDVCCFDTAPGPCRQLVAAIRSLVPDEAMTPVSLPSNATLMYAPVADEQSWRWQTQQKMMQASIINGLPFRLRNAASSLDMGNGPVEVSDLLSPKVCQPSASPFGDGAHGRMMIVRGLSGGGGVHVHLVH